MVQSYCFGASTSELLLPLKRLNSFMTVSSARPMFIRDEDTHNFISQSLVKIYQFGTQAAILCYHWGLRRLLGEATWRRNYNLERQNPSNNNLPRSPLQLALPSPYLVPYHKLYYRTFQFLNESLVASRPRTYVDLPSWLQSYRCHVGIFVNGIGRAGLLSLQSAELGVFHTLNAKLNAKGNSFNIRDVYAIIWS